MSEEPDTLRELRAFTVSVDVDRNHVTHLVRPAGSAAPVVSMRRDHPFRAPAAPFVVRPAAAPEEVIGYVAHGRAWDARQVEIGVVRGLRGPREMPFGPLVQHGLGTISLRRPGQHGLAFWIGRLVDRLDFGISVVQDIDVQIVARLRAAGATSPAFQATRLAGPIGRYEVTVPDPRISRLLILALLDCVEAATSGRRPVGPLPTAGRFDPGEGHWTQQEWLRGDGP